MSGLFITFEGGEGLGKSTQTKMLFDRYREQGNIVHALREPGGTPIGEEIRRTLKSSVDNYKMFKETELLLMNASRAQLVNEVINPALSRGEIVICDRFYDSSIAYQGYGRGIELGEVFKIVRFAVRNTIPDITFLIDGSYEDGQKNKKETNIGKIRDRIEDEGSHEFFRLVHYGFRMMAKTEPERFIVIPYVHNTIKETHEQIVQGINEFIKLKGLENYFIK